MGGEVCSDRGADPTPDVPDRHHAQSSRLQFVYQVVQDAVRNILMKDAFVAEAPQVQLQALQLENLRSRHIVDRERSEVRLPGHRANAREFGADALNLILPVRMRV